MSGSAANALREAVRAALSPLSLHGVFDMAPPRAGLPHGLIEPVIASDWSTKDWRGAELRLGISIIDSGDAISRCEALAEAVERAVLAMPRDMDGWRIASLIVLRARSGPAKESNSGKSEGGVPRWRAVTEFRARLMEVL